MVLGISIPLTSLVNQAEAQVSYECDSTVAQGCGSTQSRPLLFWILRVVRCGGESIWGGESSVEEKREKLMDQRQTAVMSEAGSTGLQEPVMHMSVQFQVL